MTEPTKKIQTWKEFFPFYLSEHSHPWNRALHLVGSSFALGFFLAFLASFSWVPLVLAVVSGYFFAWIGHFLIERNRPATFRYPFYSLLSDWVMFGMMLTRNLAIKKPK